MPICSYLYDHIPDHCEINISFRGRKTRVPFSRTERYANSFFPYCITNWNNKLISREHRYDHNFNCESPTCSCGIEDETSVHFFLCCPRYIAKRTIPLNKISDVIASDVSVLPKDRLFHIILYSPSYIGGGGGDGHPKSGQRGANCHIP